MPYKPEYTLRERWNKLLCRWFGHRWDEPHLYEIVCSRCRLCRDYTKEDYPRLGL